MPVANVLDPVPASIEVRSIDYVPDGERHGGLASQFTLWLAANLQITAIVRCPRGIRRDVFWSLVALLLGQLIGAVMAPTRHRVRSSVYPR
jgi:NCS1 family nucleobase:cation symporter-1